MKVLEEYAIECSIGKVYGSEALDDVLDQAVQIFGGYGFHEEYPVARPYRDSRVNRIFEGTNEILRLYLALTALNDVGQGLKEMASSLRGIFDDPIKGFGLLYSYGAFFETRKRIENAGLQVD